MQHKKTIAIVTFLIIAMLALSGCTSPATTTNNTTTSKFPMTVTDDFNRQTVIEKAPERIVSLSPSITEVLFALGLGDKVVGDTDYCYYPEAAKNKTKVSSVTGVNPEKIIELDPDVTFATSLTGKDTVNLLADRGLDVVVYYPENISEIYMNIRDIGNVTGTQDNASKLIADMNKRVDAVTTKVGSVNDSDKPKVLLVVWYDDQTGFYVAGSDCFGDEVIKLAGGRNAAAGVKGYGVMSTEAIIEADPDVIIVTIGEGMDAPYVSIKNTSISWLKDIKAVKNGKVYPIDTDIVSRHGPRIVEGVEATAKLLYPQLF